MGVAELGYIMIRELRARGGRKRRRKRRIRNREGELSERSFSGRKGLKGK